MVNTRGASVRRSKRQQGVDVSPTVIETKQSKRQKKVVGTEDGNDSVPETDQPGRGGDVPKHLTGRGDKSNVFGGVLEKILEEEEIEETEKGTSEDGVIEENEEEKGQDADIEENEEEKGQDEDIEESEEAEEDDVELNGDEDDVEEEKNEEHPEQLADEVVQHPEQLAEEVPTGLNPNQNTEAAETDQPSAGKKRRGLTKMRKVAKDPLDKVHVEFTSLGHTGRGSVTLSSFLGALVREHVPVLLKSWKDVDDQTRDTLWEEIQARFILEEEWQKDAVFKQMGCLWRASKSRLVSDLKSAKTQAERIKLKPSNIHSLAKWNSWVKSKTSSEFKVTSDKYRDLRMGQIPHTTSRKGMFRLACEMKKNSSDPRLVSRSKVWIAGHTHADGRPVRAEFTETIEQIKSIDSQMESTANDNIGDDAVSQVLGRDKPGRIRGLGRGVTATKLSFLQARDAHVEKLEATQALLLSQVEQLKNEVRGLAAKKFGDVSSNSGMSDGMKGGLRCQLVDWFSSNETVVAEGEYCSSEPTYKIGRIPIGPNAAAVVVNNVLEAGASVWRPTTNMKTISDAVGVKIAWPFDKVILDNDIGSQNEKNTFESQDTSSDASLPRCTLFDWSGSGEAIAEGELRSTDPKDKIIDVPLGPNAAIVKVDVVHKEATHLWRPTFDKYMIAHVMNEETAWPIDKVKLNGLTPGGRTDRTSISTASTTSGTTNGAKQKCILMDCNNSGRIVAEGRVKSTDPAAIIHFKPLGPNASIVWVDVSKVDDAIVWRPSSEVKYISDAIGTTVPWPTDKLAFS